MSRLLDFYRGNTTDIEGRLLKDIWIWDDDRLEEVHDFIQWLFPLLEPSQFNSAAPLLTEDDIADFKNDQGLKANLMKSFERILSFLGLALNADGKVVEGENFSTRIPDVWAWPNHNWLRISRILRSLTLLGMEVHAHALYDQLFAFYETKRFPIPANTFQYWTDAVAIDQWMT
ncbi:MAG: hypothetical protein JWM11_985 [Planctomycetaceae bacterium]|nr:hypothetical protein [Planctomycetaceae bacterium]